MAKSTRSPLPGRVATLAETGRRSEAVRAMRPAGLPQVPRVLTLVRTRGVADAGSQAMHFAQTPMDLLQPVADLLERFAEALLQGGVEFLVHGLAHGFQLGGILGLERDQSPSTAP